MHLKQSQQHFPKCNQFKHFLWMNQRRTHIHLSIQFTFVEHSIWAQPKPKLTECWLAQLIHNQNINKRSTILIHEYLAWHTDTHSSTHMQYACVYGGSSSRAACRRQIKWDSDRCRLMATLPALVQRSHNCTPEIVSYRNSIEYNTQRWTHSNEWMRQHTHRAQFRILSIHFPTWFSVSKSLKSTPKRFYFVCECGRCCCCYGW